MNSSSPYERYNRQILLKEFGKPAQDKLLAARVLIIGAGGLGCPALQYLAAAGIGTLGIVDDDIVSLTNLHRQPLYTMDDIGSSKAQTAAKRLVQLNPETRFIIYAERLTTTNAIKILNNFDFVIDGTDNFATRYLVNDACVLLNKPLVYGSVSQFEGQLAVFNIKQQGTISANYRDLFPEPPREDEVLNCAEAGVLGVLPGIIGTMQASETIKLITGIGKPLVNALMMYNALSNQTYEVMLEPRSETRALIPSTIENFQLCDYEWLCASRVSDLEIENELFEELMQDNRAVFIDVREEGEMPLVTEFKHQKIPLSLIKEQAFKTDRETIVLFCQTGKRSLEAARYLSGIKSQFKNIFSLRGGISQWKSNRKNSQPV